MKRYGELTAEQQTAALKLATRQVLLDIVEGGLRFNDKENGDDLQARIDIALERADEMHTPWFAHEYVMETCAENVQSLAAVLAEDAFYPSDGEVTFHLSGV